MWGTSIDMAQMSGNLVRVLGIPFTKSSPTLVHCPKEIVDEQISSIEAVPGFEKRFSQLISRHRTATALKTNFNFLSYLQLRAELWQIAREEMCWFSAFDLIEPHLKATKAELLKAFQNFLNTSKKD